MEALELVQQMDETRGSWLDSKRRIGGLREDQEALTEVRWLEQFTALNSKRVELAITSDCQERQPGIKKPNPYSAPSNWLSTKPVGSLG